MNRYSEGGGNSPEPPQQQGEPAPEEKKKTKDDALWDGTETRLVEDGAGTFEEPHTGIQISYVLKKEEIYECLKEAGNLRSNKRPLSAAITVLCAAVAAFLAAGWFLENETFFYLAVPFPLLIVLAAVLPVICNRKRANRAADGRRIHMRVYPGRIFVSKGSKRWEIPLDGSSECARIGNMIALFVKSR